MGRSRFKVHEDNRPYFLTCTVVEWIPLFTDPRLAEIVLDSLRFLQKENRLLLYAYVIMRDHLHLIAAAENLEQEIHDFKSFTAHEIVRQLKSAGEKELLLKLQAAKKIHKDDRLHQVWQEGSHFQAIDGDAMMQQKVDYIHHNPVERGYVNEGHLWKYSSACNYEGLPGVLEVYKEW